MVFGEAKGAGNSGAIAKPFNDAKNPTTTSYFLTSRRVARQGGVCVGKPLAGRHRYLAARLVAAAAFRTSGRIYAWYVVDSPEACYALRAEPRGGRALRLDADAIVAWLQPRLTGSPPHKLANSAEYLAHLRSLGLD